MVPKKDLMKARQLPQSDITVPSRRFEREEWSLRAVSWFTISAEANRLGR